MESRVWPGSDYFGGSLSTDDGVKAAAIDSMRVLLGVEGRHSPGREVYQPPTPYRTWKNV